MQALGSCFAYVGSRTAQRFLFVANEDSDTIIPFRADDQHGALKSTGDVVHNGSPVCIVFATAGSLSGPPGS